MASGTRSTRTESSFTDSFLNHWRQLSATGLIQSDITKQVNGYNINLATVIAVSRYGLRVELAPEAIQTISASASIIKDSLARGLVVYGVNTGFGGSADTRPKNIQEVQNTLLRMLQYGVLSSGTNAEFQPRSEVKTLESGRNVTKKRGLVLPADDASCTSSMPESWARASMLIRLNSLTSGASGVQLHTVKTLASLLNRNITPQIPLRGSISASGDLSPLAYIGGAMQGAPTVMAWVDSETEPGVRKLVSADRALAGENITPVSLGPKEGLAIVNGTAVSAGVAALALHEAYCQAAVCQVLTAMSVEALRGTDESFDSFISRVRPHPGQIDFSRNVFAFLRSSKLVHHTDGKDDMTLRQDRYSIRTASQWIGPILEDLILAFQQVSIELNSVTDNPLVDNTTGTILHGGNFQAKSISSAMEKTRMAMQTIGRMLFAQCTELINPTTNRGLPANLAVDDPSISFIFKGVDIMVAALTSELGFLANPVSTHVQTAEMANQSLNSLALISARYTITAIDVLTQISAAHTLALCQAFDLRAMHLKFLETFRHEFQELLTCSFAEFDGTQESSNSQVEQFAKQAWNQWVRKLDDGTNMDAEARIRSATESLQPLFTQQSSASMTSLQTLSTFTTKCTTRGLEVFERTRTSYRKSPNAAPLLGSASKRIYSFVRRQLNVPFLGESEVTVEQVLPSGQEVKEQSTIGGFITKIYESMKSGRLYDEVAECLREVEREGKTDHVRSRL